MNRPGQLIAPAGIMRASLFEDYMNMRPAELAAPAVSPALVAPGVIWISGLSSSGKSTVAREIVSQLRSAGHAAIFLDGDNLRSILKSRWGFSREERVELARVYFQISSYLASQDAVVVIAAVALYSEVREWVRSHVPNCLEIFLNVPEADRLARDRQTKGVYKKIAENDPGYDLPTGDRHVSVLDNYGGVQPKEVAAQVIKLYLNRQRSEPSQGKSSHWQTYYAANQGELSPSPFAEYVQSGVLRPGSRLLEVGCGNGRDSAFFAQAGYDVVAIDTSSAAIDLCRNKHKSSRLNFLASSISDLKLDELGRFDAVYSRFVLHAMTQSEEALFLSRAATALKPGGYLLIECRSINDPLALLGEAISPTERIHGHYRRFIVLNELVQKLKEARFELESIEESKGLAMYKDEDPVVIRAVARKPVT
jgi:adenylylsulfate kinase-like enzyme/2-polyprenyl-3-methyl-5-hydroxy-6-metoxy-1,4-benzoquinol methylase